MEETTTKLVIQILVIASLFYIIAKIIMTIFKPTHRTGIIFAQQFSLFSSIYIFYQIGKNYDNTISLTIFLVVNIFIVAILKKVKT